MAGHPSPRPMLLACALALAALTGVALTARGATLDERVALTRIALGSCADQERPQPIWQAVLDWRPELFLFLGDNVYGDVTSGQMTELREAYARVREVPGHAELRATVPHLAVWDDHDYGINNGGGDFPFKRKAEALFLDFWEVPEGDPRRARDGIYTSATFGTEGRRVQIILLDTRFFRSPPSPPDRDPAGTMLGDAQWAWLAGELRRPADLRLIVSSIQVLTEERDETWADLPHERAKLVRLIRTTGANGVLLLSGDQHFGALYRRTGDVPYPLHEMTASSLNRPNLRARAPDPIRLGGVYGAENFGTVEVDWRNREVTLALRGLGGGVVQSVTVSLATLTGT